MERRKFTREFKLEAVRLIRYIAGRESEGLPSSAR
jgi:transposase-like protein